jgi:hypothetical protein
VGISCYNEKKVIATNADRLCAMTEQSEQRRSELVFVGDDNSDGAIDTLRKIAVKTAITRGACAHLWASDRRNNRDQRRIARQTA